MMKLGLFFSGGGHHIAAWRDPKVAYGATQDFAHYAETARLAEQGKFDLLFTADTAAIFGPDDVDYWKRTAAASRLEPLTLLSALSVVTHRIGLVATATTTYAEPYHIARSFASLDRISQGRAGWNVVTSQAGAEAYNFGREAHAAHDDRYDRATEFTEVVLGLWDTWEDDSFVEDKASGLFFDAAKLHVLNHKGKHFSVRGPLTTRRSAQGRPVIVQAGQSETGRSFAARFAEVIFTVQQDRDAAIDFAKDVKARAAAFGRPPDSVKIMPGVAPVVGATRAEAEAKLDALQSLIQPELGVQVLSGILGHDMSPYPLDGPLPDLPGTDEQQGRARVVIDLARKEKLTIRQLYQRVAGIRAHRVLAGTPAEIADSLEDWYRAGAADGFNVMPLTFPDALADFVAEVIPILQARGLFRTEYEGRTLRENLGLPYPESRRAAGAAPSAGDAHATVKAK